MCIYFLTHMHKHVFNSGHVDKTQFVPNMHAYNDSDFVYGNVKTSVILKFRNYEGIYVFSALLV